MPRSKRNKIVSLTKTAAKGKSAKSKLVDSLRSYLDEYSSLYVFSFENMRASAFKDVRMHWRESKIYLGKNSITQIAFGKTPEEEYKDNIRFVSKNLEGNVGVLFTNRDKKEVLKYFNKFETPEFAKAGAVLMEDIILEPGPLLSFPIQMLDQLRKLGMVVEVDDSKVVLRTPFVCANKGVPLTPEQAKALVHLNKRTIVFKVSLICRWSDGHYQELK